VPERTTFRLFSAPFRYIQGAGALVELAPLIAARGRRPFIVADAATAAALRERIEHLLGGSVDAVVFGACGERCTASSIERLSEAARELSADVVIGLGGRSAIDTAKGVRVALDLPLLTAPTMAVCHAAVSRFFELHAEGDRPAETRMMSAGADAIIVDTAIIAAAPARQLIAGMGDVLAGKFELERHIASGASTPLGCRPPLMAVAAAEEGYRTIRQHGAGALAAMVRRTPDEALERVVEAMMLLSAIAQEQGGTSVAHLLAHRLAALPACRTALHGELVAVALLAQLVLDGRPAEFLDDLRLFYRELGLPVRLGEIGIVADKAAAVAAVARQASGEIALRIEADELAQAMLRADGADG